MITLKYIKLERCECGGTPTEESIDSWHKESRKFSCGRQIILEGGNPTNYTVRNFRECPHTEKARAQKLATESLLKALLIVCDMNTLVDVVALEDVKSSIRNSLGWRLR